MYHVLNVKHGRSYIDSPHWIKNKSETINPINEKDTLQQFH